VIAFKKFPAGSLGRLKFFGQGAIDGQIVLRQSATGKYLHVHVRESYLSWLVFASDQSQI
jgi:hypothetical protein